jgi:FtsP/CotA-like multicopper oxidase with cupredoxin domain
MRYGACIFLLLLLGMLACGHEAPEREPMLARPLAMPATLIDTNPDPSIVEVEIIASVSVMEYLDQKPAEVWAYRDGAIASSVARVPGPMLLAKKGDRVIIHFQNELPMPTTVHWHGIRPMNASDGSTQTQLAILPRGAYQYEFVAQDAGTFWYHAHVQEDVQIERGLYAPIVIQGGTEPPVSADRFFILDDIKLDATGKLSTVTDNLDMMMGRQGNVLLVNGQRRGEIAVHSGTRERWRFANAANGRFFNLRLRGHSFLVIGWDGGLIPEPYSTETLLITPGERYEVLVDLDLPPGSEVPLETIHYDRGHHIPDQGPQRILGIVYGSRAKDPPAPLPSSWRGMEPLSHDAATKIRRFELSETEDPDGPRFMVNGVSWPFDTPVEVDAADTDIWEVVNDSEMDHPFHLHGMFFQVLDVNGEPEIRLGWKDTVNVPQKATVHFAVHYELPGMWLFHCHILEHAERGMMGDLLVH